MGTASAPARADILIEQKIAQFGGPETRTRCIKEWKTKGPPHCKFKGFKLYCWDNWMKGCSEWATDFYQHEFFLKVEGPDVDEAISRPLREGLGRALAVAVTAAVATPGEVAIKAAAGYSAFKIAVVAELSKIGIADIASRYTITLKESGHW